MPCNGSTPPPREPGALGPPASIDADSRNRRTSDRFEVTWSVDCLTRDTFLYASMRNISEMGVFVLTMAPLPIGTVLTLRFAPVGSGEPFSLRGRVQWVNQVKPFAENLNPGMGVCFLDLTPDARERLVEAIHTIAYVRDEVS